MFAKTLVTRPLLFAMSMSSSSTSYVETKVASKLTAIMAKPCAWMSVSNNGTSDSSTCSSSTSGSTSTSVAMLDGYNIANMSPPILMMSSDAIPKNMLDELLLKKNTKVTLSVATTREAQCLDKVGEALTFDEMGLVATTTAADKKDDDGYPPAVESSPIHMHCHLVDKVDLGNNNDGTSSSMILLGIDTVLMKKEILTAPPPPSDPSGRIILALVDAAKLKPLAAMGHGKYGTMSELHTLLRPSADDSGAWQSDPFVVKKKAAITEENDEATSKIPDVVEWNTAEASPLGFNPLKAIVIPRPIGWISTYHPTPKVPHIAPYSFYIDVARDMVAFSAYRPADAPLKDVQLDVEEQKCFGVSTVTEEFVVAMNLSSAPIDRDVSEFDLDGSLTAEPGKYVAAPLVQGAKVQLECEYVKTVDVGLFSVLIGKVVSTKVAKSVLTADRDGIDGTKLKPVTRCGYTDEYAVIDQVVN